MKNFFFFLAFAFFSFLFNAKTAEVEINLGSGYANEVWYSFENGIVKTEPKDNWDLAFQMGQKAAIWINSQKGMALWAMPNSTADSWDETLDTTGMSSTWTVCNNSVESWDIGAFNLGKDGYLTDGDFGWGAYNMATHAISGNKLFVMKMADASYKKIMIESLINRTYTVKISNLDGTGVETFDISKNGYSLKNFVYYSIANKTIIDREPASTDWDLNFGKYMGMVSDNQGNKVPYGVTGVRTNFKYKTAKVKNLPPYTTSAPVINSGNYVELITGIGDDWKKLDHETYAYKIVDSVSYFVTRDTANNPEEKIYKIVFKSFGGSSNGKIVFDLNPDVNGIFDSPVYPSLNVYPTELDKNQNLIVELGETKSNLPIVYNVYTTNGVKIAQNEIMQATNKLTVETGNFASGVYFIHFAIDGKNYINRFVVK